MVMGVVDFPYSAFGLMNYHLPQTLLDSGIIVQSQGMSGGTLTVKTGNQHLQLSSTKEDAYYFSCNIILEKDSVLTIAG